MSSWKQSGIVTLWRYERSTRGYSGWHMTADTEGTQSLLFLLRRLRAGQEPAQYRTILVEPPTHAILRVPNFKGGRAAWIAPHKWRIHVVDAPVEADAWTFPAQLDPAELSIGRKRLDQLMRGIEDIAQGKGDYFIGDDQSAGTRLWFWWWPHLAR
jgi:hypothetical protein